MQLRTSTMCAVPLSFYRITARSRIILKIMFCEDFVLEELSLKDKSQVHVVVFER